jgi:hypothetical protein
MGTWLEQCSGHSIHKAFKRLCLKCLQRNKSRQFRSVDFIGQNTWPSRVIHWKTVYWTGVWGCAQKCASTPFSWTILWQTASNTLERNTKPQSQWGSCKVAMSSHADVSHILPHILIPPRNWWTLACTMEIVPDPPVADMLLYKNVGLGTRCASNSLGHIYIPVKHTCGTADDKCKRSWTQK